MKKIAMFRHGKKNKEGKKHLITKECLAEIKKNGIPGLNELVATAARIIIHLGTGWWRTYQTVKAYEKYLVAHGYEIAFYIRPYKRLGSVIMFNHLTSNEKLMASAEAKGWNYAITHAEENYYKTVRQNLKFALGDIFAQLSDGDLCISIGHNGLIEPLAHMVDPNTVDDAFNLKELDGIVFAASETEITVQKIIN